jgi:hypothetical protein
MRLLAGRWFVLGTLAALALGLQAFALRNHPSSTTTAFRSAV